MAPKENVLIVADSWLTRRILLSFLQVYGFQPTVFEADDGPQAVQILSGLPVALMICEAEILLRGNAYLLSGMRNLARAYRVPLIVISADAGHKLQLEHTDLDLRAVLEQPFHRQQLCEALVAFYWNSPKPLLGAR